VLRHGAGGQPAPRAQAKPRPYSRQPGGRKPPLAAYSTDGVASYGLNFVPNLTRSPEVWLYLHSHYETAVLASPGVLVLRRNPSRQQRWSMQRTELPVRAAARKAFFGRNGVVDVADGISWPSPADLLEITLRVRYPFWWRVLKPSHLFVELRFADGTEKNVVVIAPPNRDSNLWIYPWRDGDLENYFSVDESAWRKGVPRPAVERVRIAPYRLDQFSVNPTALEVERLQAVAALACRRARLPCFPFERRRSQISSCTDTEIAIPVDEW